MLTTVFDLSWWKIIPVVFLVEIGVLFFISPPHHLQVPADSSENQKIQSIANGLRTASLSIAGLSFARLTVILTSDSVDDLTATVRLLYLSIGFLFISFFTWDSVRDRRIWVLFQEETMKYGTLTLLVSILYLVQYYIPDISDFLVSILLSVLLIRIFGLYGEIGAYLTTWDNNKYQNRCEYFREVVDNLRQRGICAIINPSK